MLIRDHPADRGVPPFGGTEVERPPVVPGSPFARGAAAPRDAAATPHLLAAGGHVLHLRATAGGSIGTHLVPAAHDHGIAEAQAARLLAVIGVLDTGGVTTVGWILAAHQLGAAAAARAGGVVRASAAPAATPVA